MQIARRLCLSLRCSSTVFVRAFFSYICFLQWCPFDPENIPSSLVTPISVQINKMSLSRIRTNLDEKYFNSAKTRIFPSVSPLEQKRRHKVNCSPRWLVDVMQRVVYLFLPLCLSRVVVNDDVDAYHELCRITILRLRMRNLCYHL